MRIKKLELIGFKSFKDRTVIQFDAGITGIVGPNGCGKSNIVDALVWVMGEMSAKHLRGSSMEDVIFAGAEGYAPMGMAEVSLTLENDGGPFPVQYQKFSEVMVTRRLHRSGDSEYFINKEPARLRDIQEIFMDTGAGAKGFSIIAQGMIGQMITAKPEDRRNLIEEAAGITKFKARKRESVRKLESTDQNLTRLADIIGELRRQIDSLQRQAQRAERYRNLKREAEDLDLWISSRQYLDVKSAHEASLAELASIEDEASRNQTDLATREAQLASLRTDLAERSTRVQDQGRALETERLTVRDLEREISDLRLEIEQARSKQELTGTLLEQNSARKQALESDLERVSSQLVEIRSEAASLIERFQERRSIYSAQSERIGAIDIELTDLRRELLTVSQAAASLEARSSGLREAVESLREREDEHRLVLEDLIGKKNEFEGRRRKVWTELERERQESLDLARDVESFEANKASISQQLESSRSGLEAAKDSLNEVTSRLYGLENLAANFEGFEAGVKSVMFWQKQRLESVPETERDEATSFHPIAEIVEVPPEYEVAMEAALGPRLQMLVSASANDAVGAVQFLKEQNSGRSSFVAGGLSVQTTPSRPLPEGRVRAVLANVIRAPERFRPTVLRLLDRVAVVDSLNEALTLRNEHPEWSFVTVDGDMVTAEGVISGGTAESADSGVLKRRREIKELSLAKDEWSGKVALAQVSLKKLESSLKALVEDLEQAVKRRTEKEIVLAALKKDMERAEHELQNVQTAIERQERDVLSAVSQRETRETELTELLARRENLLSRKAELESSSESLTTELLTAKNGIDELRDAVTRLEVESARKTSERESLEREQVRLQDGLTQVVSQLGEMSEESHRSAQTMSSGEVRLEEQKVRLEAAISRVEDLEGVVSRERDEYESLGASAREVERQVALELSARGAAQSRISDLRVQAEQSRLREQHLVEQIRERYILELSEVSQRYRDREGDLSEAEVQLRDLREKLGKIGDVNLSAIEEYDDVQKRYEFLNQQHTDLIEAKEQLRRVIDKINRICAKRFRDTFEQVNERFQKVFPVLFGGGEAQLQLIEDPEKGEMGIDIIAKPPGKKLQSVSLLSGGEKALTAVSLVFSIFLVRPSPYCLLDEVDAPLDDANVTRFNDLVREMAKRSQIIVVTHNKYTMEVASKLYGVTMEEKGVSKMVSVNLAEAARVV
jgi:chromosome segregation protein